MNVKPVCVCIMYCDNVTTNKKNKVCLTTNVLILLTYILIIK